MSVAALVISGCSDNELGLEKRRPNLPPETLISRGPTDFSSSPYTVRLSWWGSDSDGTIDHFDFIMVEHAGAVDTLTAETRQAILEVPAVDDPRWIGTTATDSVFVTLADTLRRDPVPGEGESPGDVLRHPFERWHTFFVRAVDNEGLPDPTPEYLSFNARNFAPTVRLRRPVSAGAKFQSPPAVFFSWDGDDPLEGGDFTKPVASRWTLITSGIALGGDFTSWPDSLYHLPTRFSWSPWSAWGAADSSGVRTLVRGLDPIGLPNRGFYIFAVQALDEAGAITPVFDTTTPGKNNAVLIRVSGPPGPTLITREPFLGAFTALGNARPVQVDAAAGQRIQFRWSADASLYGGEIAGYRYGWDLLDPSDERQWEKNWSLAAVQAPARHFPRGTHRFYVQARDNADNVTAAVYTIVIHELTKERDLLWVDDTAPLVPGSATELKEDLLWTDAFSDLAVEHGFTFDPVVDVYDTGDRKSEPPPIDLVFRYKVVVWSVRSSTGPDNSSISGLSILTRFADPFASRNQVETRRFNYISTYINSGGSLWINGFRPALQMWPVERAQGGTHAPVNVTNWDDPLEPHPLIDSAGTTSLLYQMGVEMFDVGATSGAPRSDPSHFCVGLERTTASAFELQRFESSLDHGHAHELELATSTVESFTDQLIELQTSAVDEHRHTIELQREDLLALRSGDPVIVATSNDGLPEGHSHGIELRDQLGYWGAPLLIPGAGWEWIPGGSGRSGVEIYNMPNAMAAQRPPLHVDPRRTLALYTYVSGVRADSDAGTVYPLTADGQPTIILSKRFANDPIYSRALTGFEPHFLFQFSHQGLVEFVVVRHFRLGSGGASP